MSHDRIARVFDEWALAGKAEGMEDGHGDVVRQVLETMDVRPGMQLLDVGCGNGWATRLLGKLAPGAQAVGIDVSPGMIARADETSDWTSRARFEQMPFEQLDLPDGRFDRVFSMEAIYYSVDLERALAELFRVTKPGGTADVVVDRFKESPHTEGWAEQVGVKMHWLGEDEWRAAFEGAGYRPVQLQRLLDRRGPGSEEEFAPDAHCPDFQTRMELHAAGSLWIRASRPPESR